MTRAEAIQRLSGEGASQYRAAMETCRGNTRRQKFEEAGATFQRAVALLRPGDMVETVRSTQRNRARAAHKAGVEIAEGGASVGTPDRARFYFREAAECYAAALALPLPLTKAGSALQDVDTLLREAWLAGKCQSTQEAILSIIDRTAREAQGEGSGLRAALLHQGCATFKLTYAELLYHEAIRIGSAEGAGGGAADEMLGATMETNKGGWRRSKGLLEEAARPLSLAMDSIDRMPEVDGSQLRETHDQLRSDIQDEIDSRTSISRRCEALQLLKSAVSGGEDVSMEGVYASLDMLHESIILGHQKDIESEACSQSWIGYVYARTLKNKGRAHTFYRQSMSLAMTLQPKASQFDTHWYKEAQKFVEEMQKEVLEGDEEKLKDTRKDLEPVLKSLREEADKGSIYGLLRYIYKTHPPKNANHKLEEPLTPENLKARTRQALLHYHPDSVTNTLKQCMDLEWTVICLEITKYLNNEYACC